MAYTMTEAHKRKLAKGRAKAREKAAIAGISRVETYHAWLKEEPKDGPWLRRIPEVPTKADYYHYNRANGIIDIESDND